MPRTDKDGHVGIDNEGRAQAFETGDQRLIGCHLCCRGSADRINILKLLHTRSGETKQTSRTESSTNYNARKTGMSNYWDVPCVEYTELYSRHCALYS